MQARAFSRYRIVRDLPLFHDQLGAFISRRLLSWGSSPDVTLANPPLAAGSKVSPQKMQPSPLTSDLFTNPLRTPMHSAALRAVVTRSKSSHLTGVKKRAPMIPARFRKKCVRAKLSAAGLARFALESIAASDDLFAEIAREYKKEVAQRQKR